MSEKKNGVQSLEGYVKKEVMFAAIFVSFIAGALTGIVYFSFKTGDSSRQFSQPAVQSQGVPQQQAMSPEDANKILSLENEVAQYPDNVEAWTNLGNIYFDTGKSEKAIKAYEKSLALSPGDPNVLTDLGVMYRRVGQPDKAIEKFDLASQSDPRHEQSRFNKGIVQMHDLNDTEGAIKTWEELVAVNPFAQSPNGGTVKEMIEGFKKGAQK